MALHQKDTGFFSRLCTKTRQSFWQASSEREMLTKDFTDYLGQFIGVVVDISFVTSSICKLCKLREVI